MQLTEAKVAAATFAILLGAGTGTFAMLHHANGAGENPKQVQVRSSRASDTEDSTTTTTTSTTQPAPPPTTAATSPPAPASPAPKPAPRPTPPPTTQPTSPPPSGCLPLLPCA